MLDPAIAFFDSSMSGNGCYHKRSATYRLGRSVPALLALVVLCMAGGGCIVTQPRGDGKLARHVEPTTHRAYWLYLPRDLARRENTLTPSRRWPLVVTLHGMKPFDTAHRQAREWESEADRYGFVVLAPELDSPDLLRQFPLRGRTPAFEADVKTVLAAMNQVEKKVPIDYRYVLVTSWSSGGYLCHYLLNRYPELFTVLVARQSTFSPDILDAGAARAAMHRPVLLITGAQDFPMTIRDARKALEWYHGHGYTGLWYAHLTGRGHMRTPDIAAGFFAELSGRGPAPARIRKILDNAMVLRGGQASAFLRD